jgi:hypothetical protein
MDDDCAWRISIHEAGHAVCSRLVGLPSGCALVGETQAYARFRREWSAAGVAALMAGVAAEIVVFGGYDRTGCKTDMEHAEMRLVALGYDDDGSAELWRWTLDLMREHLDTIMRLATKLFLARSLSGDEIDALMLGACR